MRKLPGPVYGLDVLLVSVASLATFVYFLLIVPRFFVFWLFGSPTGVSMPAGFAIRKIVLEST